MKVVKNLGILVDNNLSMEEQVSSICGTCFHTLRLLKTVFPWLPISSRRTLIQALIISRLDYENALLVAANETLLSRLQVVQNTVAHLVYKVSAGTSSIPMSHSQTPHGEWYILPMSQAFLVSSQQKYEVHG